MPIDYKNYPSNWFTKIRPEVLRKAGNCCQFCGIRNYSVGHRDNEGNFHPTAGNIIHDLAGQGLSHPSMKPISYQEARDLADFINEEPETERHIVIVLCVLSFPYKNKVKRVAACQKCHRRVYENFKR